MKGKLVLRIIPCGLGNQLFQYAAGLGLARTWQVPMVVDASWFSLPADKKPKPLRAYGLDAFALTAPSASPEEVSYFLDDGPLARGRRLVDFVRSGGQHALIGDWPFRQRKPHPAFQEPAARRPVQMAGFWECAEYPEIGGEELRRELAFRAPPDAENARYATEITRSQGVAVHVRGRDLITHAAQARRHVPGRDYYAAAAERIAMQVEEPVFYVFTDDLAYAREVVQLPYPTRFVVHNADGRDHEDLRLMTLCRHHVLACSTFSWWGAWLARSPGQCVIAPRVFYVDGKPPIDHYYPKSWILI